jgi:hypothetical protein
MKTNQLLHLKNLFAAIALGLATLGAAPALAAPFTVSVDGLEVTDAATGLIWRRCSEGQLYNAGACTGSPSLFPHELAVVRARTEAAMAGAPAWRLPNVKELASIADISLASPAIDATAFPGTSYPNGYWSSSPVADTPTSAWVVRFGSGQVGTEFRSFPDPVRLVRAGP